MNIRKILNDRVRLSMDALGVPAECSANISLSKQVKFGDYQANGVMGAGKKLGVNPRELALNIVDKLNLSDIAEKVEVAGPGFINIHLNYSWLSKRLEQALNDDRLGISAVSEPLNIVVDYSSPNLAKEMHVGHIRPTAIGDTVVRVLEFLGHKVVRQNHVGDWGTQFGMLLAHLADGKSGGEDVEIVLADLEVFYREAKKRFDEEEGFDQRARDYVVKLQNGDKTCLTLWEQFIKTSLSHADDIYERLNISLGSENVAGESFYNPYLSEVVEDLLNQGIAKRDQGAVVCFIDEQKDKDGNPAVMIIQKKDGGYLYATTDLAAVRYRTRELHADRVLYFIDMRQSQHMQQVFSVSQAAGYADETVSLEHHPFGTINGSDGKPFKTRSGGTVKLGDLLDEAVERAKKIILEKNPDLDEVSLGEIAQKVGIGAVKYADLSKTRTNDYVFNWDLMLSFEGNTAPYLQYAYSRVQSIFRKAELDPANIRGEVLIVSLQEKSLSLKLSQFEEVLQQVANEAYPHILCNYLYELASCYMSFYESCPILKSDVDEKSRNSRLLLCHLTGRVLKQGLELLGIETMDKM
ncbi:arginine--tRNA ligase [Spartinivicinus poritis]|uniref:Arginine--tRNA ligase n=1 Tax=Spartinivicinus poritis TaxID=2994640 RepID=A0ABT5U817_9GAMM|nr:arginine--tRNA ligase [Spartinivicinus sp. A2-2]MDE1462515.1 arginine--tRNA ligase [Spartinivicinus sp. A2-2]